MKRAKVPQVLRMLRFVLRSVKIEAGINGACHGNWTSAETEGASPLPCCFSVPQCQTLSCDCSHCIVDLQARKQNATV